MASVLAGHGGCSTFRRSFSTCYEKGRAPPIKPRGRVTPPESSTPDRWVVFSARPLLSHRSVSGNLPNVQRKNLTGPPWRADRPNLSSVLQANETEPNNAHHFQLRHGRSSVCVRRVWYEAHATGAEKSVPRAFVFRLPRIEGRDGVPRVTDSHSAAVGSECSRKKRSISLAASGPRGSV